MAGAIVGGAPTWVYGLLAVLIALGVRRLKTREVPIAVALIPVFAFGIWSLFGLAGFAGQAGYPIALGAWLAGAILGGLSARALPDPRAVRLPANRIRLPGSWLPLALYMTVFIARFACGAWAAINPVQATLATAIGVAISAAMTLRLAVSAWSWRSA
jgi:hypothetical protein